MLCSAVFAADNNLAGHSGIFDNLCLRRRLAIRELAKDEIKKTRYRVVTLAAAGLLNDGGNQLFVFDNEILELTAIAREPFEKPGIVVDQLAGDERCDAHKQRRGMATRWPVKVNRRMQPEASILVAGDTLRHREGSVQHRDGAAAVNIFSFLLDLGRLTLLVSFCDKDEIREERQG